MFEENHIHVRRSARYYTLGPDDDGAVRDVWFVLHGYGQLASQFINIFTAIDDGTRLIVAPEALNRFYVAGVESAPAAERAVGATWMTYEDRLNEIRDYVAYLDAVSATVLDRFRGQGSAPRVVLLGFSQATATAARWVGQGALRPAHLVLWGGLLPPDEELSAPDHPLRKPTLHIRAGVRDRFLSAERMSDEERRLRDAGFGPRVERYIGGHGITKDALLELARSLGSLPNE